MLKHVYALLLMAAAAIPAIAQVDFIAADPLREAGFMKYWQLQLPLEPHQEVADVFYVDDQVYVSTNDGYVFAIHADTGVVRWLRPVTRSGYRIKRPLHIGEVVVFSTPTGLLELDRRVGDSIRHIDLPFTQGSGPATDGALIIVGGIDRRCYAYAAQTGLLVWKFSTNGSIFSTPALLGDNMYIASGDGAIYCAERKNKRFRWQAVTFGSVDADLVATDAGIFAAGTDNTLYLFDPSFGEVRWRYRFSGPLYDSPVVIGSTCYQYCEGDGLVSLNVDVLDVQDRMRWVLPKGRSVITADEKRLYVLTVDGTVIAVDPANGETKATIPVSGFTMPLENIGARTIALAGRGGRVFFARPIGTSLAKVGDLRAALLPPGAANAATTQPTAKNAAERDPLASARTSTPMGGKSNVSKDYGKRQAEPKKDDKGDEKKPEK